MSKQLESAVERHLVSRVEKELGGMALKGDVPGRRFLDRILVLDQGVTIYCECKRPQGGKYSRHQLETVERLALRGHYVLLVNTVEGVNKWVNEYMGKRGLWGLCTHLSGYPQPGVFFIGPSLRSRIWDMVPHE